MFSQIVLIQQFLLHGQNTRFKHQGVEVHERNFLQHHGIMNGVHRIDPPREWAVTVNKNRGNGIRIFPLEGFLDYQPCFPFVLAFDLGFRHYSSAGDLTIEIITVGCAKCYDGVTCLSKAGCPAAVSMHDAANIGKRFIEFEVSRRIGRRP